MKFDTNYLGIKIKNSLIPAASLLTNDLSNLKKWKTLEQEQLFWAHFSKNK